MKVKIKRLFDGAMLPDYATDGAGAMDLHACINRAERILPGQTTAIPTGIAVEVPVGYGMFITPRSGLALKHGVTVLNSPGLVDADFRGEVRVILHNSSDTAFFINPDAKIAQACIIELPEIEWEEVDDLSDTARGQGGFGSTGM